MTRNFWRRGSAALLTTLGILAAACGGSGQSNTPSDDKSPVTLQVDVINGGPVNAANWQADADAYKKDHPNVTVVFNALPVDQYPTTVTTQLKGGGGPDLFYTNGGSGQIDSALPLGKSGQVADLSGESWAKSLPSSAKTLFWNGNKLYALPLAVVAVGIVYNTDLISTWGITVPTTFNDLLTDCATAKTKGGTLLAVAGANPQNTGLLGQMIAGSFVYNSVPDWNIQRANNKVTFANTQSWVNSLDAITKMNQAGCFQPGASGFTSPAAQATVGQKKALGYPAPGGVVNQIQALDPSSHYGMMPFPGQSSGDTRPTLAYSDSMSVNAHSKNKAQAIKFLDFLATGDRPAGYAKANSALTLQQAATSSDLPTSLQAFGPYLKANKSSALPNLTWPNPIVYQDFGSGIQGLLTGQTTSKGILSKMDSDWSS